ncbi:Metallo-peptidase family M12B Reprolysin-like-domain-containing protein [Catenaria anguillulae PL171]|uniref:Disintegrin and metalloproteinase domain-containing protein B n=1 Tax=Catenaria anguillulae PL171 TaxID=765915 RepID=A0A1Y2H6Q7_9FUNG|nr:Metallo-peptidase family M12B Reprolysin-like-domain-containing protein [Catenaria anguillulae PL171]
MAMAMATSSSPLPRQPRRPRATLLLPLAIVLLGLSLLSPTPARAHTHDSPDDDLLHYQLLTSPPTLDIVRPGKVHLHKRTLPAVHPDDHVRIQLQAFNRTFHLHLEPYKHLIHPDAQVEVHYGNGRIVTKPLVARVFKGHVVESPHASSEIKQWDQAGILGKWPVDGSSPAHWKHDWFVGDARVVVEHDGMSDHDELAQQYPATTRRPIFHAHFSVNDERYTVSPIHAYNARRKPNDPEIAPFKVRRSIGGPKAAEATMVIYRDSDTRAGAASRMSALRKREAGSSALHKRLIKPGAKLQFDSGSEACGSGHTKWNLERRLELAAQRDAVPIVFGGNFSDPLSTSSSSPASPLVKRQARTTTQRATPATAFPQVSSTGSACLGDQKFLYMGVASDCTYSQLFQNSESAVLTQLINVWAEVSNKYLQTFNVGVGITTTVIKLSCGDETWNQPCDNNKLNIVQRLSAFSQWRGARGAQSDEGAWHLMSQCNTASTLGIAWTGTLCTITASQQPRAADPSLGTPAGTDFVSGTGVSTVTREQWKVVAHELGHNFGAIHDCTGRDCQAGQASGQTLAELSCAPCEQSASNGGNCDCGQRFIMNPTDSAQAQDFSPKSIETMCNTARRWARGSQARTCLLPLGAKKMLRGAECGNGIVEEGEQCDCGAKCDADPCCTTQCRFKGAAVCSDANSPGCCAQCQFKPAGTVCRAATEFCDLPEQCTGSSAACPTDQFRPNGTPCQLNNTAQFPKLTLENAPTTCATGMCASRNTQCFLASKGQTRVFASACPAQQGNCGATCLDSSTGVCYSLDSTFVDGTPCGFGSECEAGTCKGFAPLNLLSSWVYANTTVSIIVGVILGLALLSCLYSCCLKRALDRFRGKKKPAIRIPGPSMTPAPQRTNERPNRVANNSTPASGSTGARPSPPSEPTRADQLYNEQLVFLSNSVSNDRPAPAPSSSAPPNANHPLLREQEEYLASVQHSGHSAPINNQYGLPPVPPPVQPQAAYYPPDPYNDPYAHPPPPPQQQQQQQYYDYAQYPTPSSSAPPPMSTPPDAYAGYGAPLQQQSGRYPGGR